MLAHYTRILYTCTHYTPMDTLPTQKHLQYMFARMHLHTHTHTRTLHIKTPTLHTHKQIHTHNTTLQVHKHTWTHTQNAHTTHTVYCTHTHNTTLCTCHIIHYTHITTIKLQYYAINIGGFAALTTIIRSLWPTEWAWNLQCLLVTSQSKLITE